MMRNAAEVIDTIHAARGTGDKHGLRNTKALLSHLALCQQVPVIHVAGTNGKGSTCAMLESVLRHAGMRTGLYTSPFLQAYNERMRIDGLPVDDDTLARCGNPVLDAADVLHAQDIHPTPFELGTALALSIFADQQVDVAVVEVGLGGRLDPTNVVNPTVCAITAIGMDHMAILGDTLTAIAGEKAGIIKENVPVVVHPAEPEVEAVFCTAAGEKHAPLRQLEQGMIVSAQEDMTGSTITVQLERLWENVRVPLPGKHQQRNAMTVIAVCEELMRQGFAITPESVRAGIAAAKWPARLEWCGNILLDGAHNAQGVAMLQDYVRTNLSDKRRVLLTGVLTEKLGDDMLAELASLADDIVTVTPDSYRAMTGAELAERFAAIGRVAHPCASVSEGVLKAQSLAGSDGIVVAAGSLYLMGELRSVLKLPWR